MVIDRAFWPGKRVLVTGHTGFKGGWLCTWLKDLGATVFGYALAPEGAPNLFELARVGDGLDSTIADIRDLGSLQRCFDRADPDVVFHLAAQPLVRRSYALPRETFEVNMMGTVNVLECVRISGEPRAVVVVTTDKCYENREWMWGYRENEPLGGRDPYSGSKAAAELVTAAFRESFFNVARFERHRVGIASARAGNVIGGGDWSEDRLLSDLVRSTGPGPEVQIRNPEATRPWQHVLESISGYLMLAQALASDGPRYASAWNFGPTDDDSRTVSWIAAEFAALWGAGEVRWRVESGEKVHEAQQLKLDSSKARALLKWRPRLDTRSALGMVADWHKAHKRGEGMQDFTRMQIDSYLHKGTVT